MVRARLAVEVKDEVLRKRVWILSLSGQHFIHRRIKVEPNRFLRRSFRTVICRAQNNAILRDQFRRRLQRVDREQLSFLQIFHSERSGFPVSFVRRLTFHCFIFPFVSIRRP